MAFITDLFTSTTIAHTLFIFGLVACLGLLLGSLRFKGISLGVAGVLFSGLLFGHFGIAIDHEILDFAREFGLILFVYTIGLQVGPGFFSSFKRDGLTLNLLAVFIVICGALIAAAFALWGGIPLPAAAGLFSGATTNTPSLAAAQQALKDIPGLMPEAGKLPALGYAVAYPFGIVGIIITMLLIRFLLRINPSQDASTYAEMHARMNPKLEVIDLRVENSNLHGLQLKNIPSLNDSGVVISRVYHEGVLQAALPATTIHLGDIIRAVGPRDKLNDLRVIIGTETQLDLRGTKGHTIARRVIVSRTAMSGKTIAELDARQRYGVTITRLTRSDMELPVTPDITVNFADTLMAVGDEDAVRKFAAEMGDSPKELNHPQLIPVFLGIVLGVLLGTFPFHIPGIPSAVKLGLAGGPLVVAILLSRLGRLGPLVWYMPAAANIMLREVGITLFLACVGLKAGDQFVKTLVQGDGLYWMAAGTAITLVPLLAAAFWARLKLKMNYLTLCGLLAGSMTDPPALAFANQMVPSSAQVVAYASVYPVVMLLRVICAQCLIIFFMR